jgi:D-alanyl-D-alanine dipeptidase
MNFKRHLSAWVLASLLLVSCQAPPRERGDFRAADLVELTRLDPSIRLEIRYANTNNFLGHPVYKQARAFLQRPAAEALVHANEALRPLGYGLLVFDGYRPWAVTKMFWDAATPQQRQIGFVANPKEGSKHNRGCAVDLTLCELASGKEVAMPSVYDEFSDRAFPNYQGGSAEARRTRDLLRSTMEAQHFTVWPSEWWHFDYQDWPKYKILNIPFEAMGR